MPALCRPSNEIQDQFKWHFGAGKAMITRVHKLNQNQILFKNIQEVKLRTLVFVGL